MADDSDHNRLLAVAEKWRRLYEEREAELVAVRAALDASETLVEDIGAENERLGALVARENRSAAALRNLVAARNDGAEEHFAECPLPPDANCQTCIRWGRAWQEAAAAGTGPTTEPSWYEPTADALTVERARRACGMSERDE